MSTAMNKSVEAARVPEKSIISGYWDYPATITVTNYQFKSLSDFVFNTAVGCLHGCTPCYVPGASANKQHEKLAERGVDDPDEQWGQYALLRVWDEKRFLSSLKTAENMASEDLKPEGHRAIMFCSTTDPYQTIRNADPKLGTEYTKHHQEMVRRALELIRDRSTLNVRILTRSPLAKTDFELFKSFGNRLAFGMSLPTLNDAVSKAYEPGAPGVKKRLATLKAAKDAGLHVYVAMAPTYPECDEADLRATMKAIAALEPITVFHEPLNIRADNIERIRKHGEKEEIKLNLSPFETTDAWRKYSWEHFQLIEKIATEVGMSHCLHLWPDQDMATRAYLQSLPDPTGFVEWLQKWWTRISEWPE